jgi:hypothetical protein
MCFESKKKFKSIQASRIERFRLCPSGARDTLKTRHHFLSLIQQHMALDVKIKQVLLIFIQIFTARCNDR